MNLTRWIIVAITIGTLVVDAWLASRFGLDSTISVQMTQWSHQYIAIPLAWGFLMGHWFAQNGD